MSDDLTPADPDGPETDDLPGRLAWLARRLAETLEEAAEKKLAHPELLKLLRNVQRFVELLAHEQSQGRPPAGRYFDYRSLQRQAMARD